MKHPLNGASPFTCVACRYINDKGGGAGVATAPTGTTDGCSAPEDTPPKFLPSGLLSWIVPVWRYKEEEVIATAGLDVAVFFRMLSLGAGFTLFVGCCSVIISEKASPVKFSKVTVTLATCTIELAYMHTVSQACAAMRTWLITSKHHYATHNPGHNNG